MAADQLIIFVRNPVPGTVKTDIAQAIGDEKAVQVHSALLTHTAEVVRAFVQSGDVSAAVYYGDFVNDQDLWDGFEKKLQQGSNLGERMQQAFRERFDAGAERVVVISPNCLELTPEHLKDAYHTLRDGDVVIGPATNGTYYLLGMRKLFTCLFENKPWGQATLLQETVQELELEAITYGRLTTLSDVKEWEDVLRYNL